MAKKITIKQGDTWPELEAVLEETVGGVTKPIDLSTATKVVLIGKSGTKTIGAECTSFKSSAGVVKYKWKTTDTENAATFEIEWQITWPSGIQSVPNEEYDELVITPNL